MSIFEDLNDLKKHYEIGTLALTEYEDLRSHVLNRYKEKIDNDYRANSFLTQTTSHNNPVFSSPAEFIPFSLDIEENKNSDPQVQQKDLEDDKVETDEEIEFGDQDTSNEHIFRAYSSPLKIKSEIEFKEYLYSSAIPLESVPINEGLISSKVEDKMTILETAVLDLSDLCSSKVDDPTESLFSLSENQFWSMTIKANTILKNPWI